MTDEEYVEKVKSHLHWEEGMDETMLPFYIDNAKRYVQKATGGQREFLVIMVASIMYEYPVAEKELGEALDAMTPFFLQEAYADGETTDEQA